MTENCSHCYAPLSIYNIIKDKNGDKFCRFCHCKVEPVSNDENFNYEFQEAVGLRNRGEFKKASNQLRNLLEKDPNNHKILWQLLLCKYGVVYAEQEYNNKLLERKITCWEKVDSNIERDKDYRTIIDQLSGRNRKQYIEDASKIAEIQRKIQNTEKADYDIFICYKETNSYRKRTFDSGFAEIVCHALEAENYKVFFARETLKKTPGFDYEVTIFNAVSSAKIMLVIGFEKEYFETTWVQNEWRRFLYSMKKDNQKRLIPVYNYLQNLPQKFKDENLEGVQIKDFNEIDDLKEKIHEIIPRISNKVYVKNEAAFEKVVEGEKYLSLGENNEAIDCFRSAARAGNTKACYYLGVDYYTKEDPNSEEAFKWFKKAAEGGLIQAQEQISFMYELGEGVEKNKSKADYWKDKLEQSGKETYYD